MGMKYCSNLYATAEVIPMPNLVVFGCDLVCDYHVTSFWCL